MAPLVAGSAPGGHRTNPVGFEAGEILKGGGFADSAPLSRILIHFLGGTRKWPPEGPSQRKCQANVERKSTENCLAQNLHIFRHRRPFQDLNVDFPEAFAGDRLGGDQGGFQEGFVAAAESQGAQGGALSYRGGDGV